MMFQVAYVCVYEAGIFLHRYEFTSGEVREERGFNGGVSDSSFKPPKPPQRPEEDLGYRMDLIRPIRIGVKQLARYLGWQSPFRSSWLL